MVLQKQVGRKSFSSGSSRRLSITTLFLIMATEQKFKIGDEVRHKSGGPKMVVKGYAGEEVICEWFDQSTLHEKAFHPDTLKKYEPRQIRFGSM